MNIFLVRRYGHDESGEGANGPDTFFLVRARDRDDAAQLVDQILKDYPHKTVETTCHCISEIGIDTGALQDSSIIHGPWYSRAHLDLSGYLNWFREWHTNEQWKNQDTWGIDEKGEAEQGAAANP
jgi:hypothetical protein